ncbi:AAA family ATPase [Chromohalobacter sp. 296-RDG]|uniref:AAA family ATPase n=1 Tax=Chromohalobacter sp. 296-RDG TaxID=2994062 RepID=UPI002469BC4B|nr:AAA family ATPase [Chromohalobacter sp. 296-RDG]
MIQDTPVPPRLMLFGHFSMTLGRTTLTQFSYDKVKALLVYLLLNEQAANRAGLAEMLWPAQGLSSGRTNLRHALHCLRQCLGDEAESVLTVSRQSIELRLESHWVMDVRRLETLLQAPPEIGAIDELLTLYRGDLVEELHLPQCSDFQRWLVKVRGEWRQRMIAYIEHALDGVDDVSEAILRQLVSRFSGYGPFHERLVRQLAEKGQIAAAHEQFNAYLELLALSGQQPDAEFLQLARYWSDGAQPTAPTSPQGAFSRTVALDSAPVREDEIDYRQLSVMAIRLHLQGDWQERAQGHACLLLQVELMRWLERQCHLLGGFWLPGATGGLGLACFGTHGPTHQLAELVALYEHCRRQLPEEVQRHWSGGDPAPRFELAAGLNSGRGLYLPERRLADPLGQVTQPALELMSAAQGSELVISQEASQHMPPALDLQPRLTTRLLAADGRVRLRALVLGVDEGGRDATPPSLIGREAALRQLRDALARVVIGLRQSVLVQGALGKGKSALLVSFRQLEQSQEIALCWQPTTRLSTQTPYGVVRSLLRWYLDRDVDSSTLAAWLANESTLDESRREVLYHALSDGGSGDIGESLEPVTQLFHSLIERITASRPLALVIDDLQWLDELSLKMLLALQARLPINVPFMLIASHHGREALPVRLDWDQQIVLGRLDSTQSSRLLVQLAKHYRLHISPRLREQLIERCDGVPLYLQEICRRLDMDRREGRRVQVDELPRGLLGLLSSRIEQLDADRDVAHVAAVLGRQFRGTFLRECTGLGETRLKQVLDHMQRLEIIEPCHGDNPFDYQFVHQLLQEAAYLSCPRDVRERLHHQVVTLIEERFPASIGQHPGYFASHLRHSGDHARAARYFELAARAALKLSANRTALQMADSGLECLQDLASQEERHISLLTVRGQAAFALEGHGSPTAHESFVRAKDMLGTLEARRVEDDDPDDEQPFLVTWGLWVGCSQRHAHADAFALASRLSTCAEGLVDPRYQRLADYARAHCEYWVGRVRHAVEHLEEIDPLHQPMVLDWLPFSDHPQIAAACYHAWALCLRGDYLRAEQQIEAAIRLAESIKHPGSLALSLIFAAALYRQLGHVHMAATRAERAHEVTSTPDLHLWHYAAQGILGWYNAMSGDPQGLELLEESMERATEATGQDRYQRPLLWYGDACLALGEYARAEDYLDQCLMVARERDSLYLPELTLQMVRVRHALGGAPQDVRRLAEQAYRVASEQENRHHQINACEVWLTLVDPDDDDMRQRFRQWLGQVSLTDAPMLVRWRLQLDRAFEPQRERT